MKKLSKIDRVYRMLNAQNEMVTKLREAKDGAYRERNQIVAALSKLFPAWLGRHDAGDKTWHGEWMNIVYIQLPTGQVSWHMHDNDFPLFAHLDYGLVEWDGHTTEEKYQRLSNLKSK